MNTKLILTCLTLSALLGSVNGCTEDNDTNRTEPKVYAEDAALTTKIKANLAKSSMASIVKIYVDTVNNGDVTLTGNAKTQAEIDEAVSITRNTEGVKNVNNMIVIKADE